MVNKKKLKGYKNNTCINYDYIRREKEIRVFLRAEKKEADLRKLGG